MKVVLVNMPFAPSTRPSLSCGLLKAIAQRAGVEVCVTYYNLEMAVALGQDTFSLVGQDSREVYLGDWLFSAAAFGSRSDNNDYLERIPTSLRDSHRLGAEKLLRLRGNTIPALLNKWSTDEIWRAARVAAFSCTFQQTVASLALARILKMRFPAITTVFGGADFDQEKASEIVRTCSWVDYIIVGEGDEAFPDFLERVEHGKPLDALPGLVYRCGSGVVSNSPEFVRDLDSLPDPIFDEYFDAMSDEHLIQLREEKVVLPIQSARGCWWGQKHHCTFCGLNNVGGIAFRSKSPDGVLGEMSRLSIKHQTLAFQASDNIMDMEYIKTLFPCLHANQLDFELQYETKANLDPDQVRILSEGGLRWFQPGIESLSTPSLQRMRKGTSMLVNVRLLKWARYYGIVPNWNILLGIPGETPEDVKTQTDLIKSMFHLHPPMNAGIIGLYKYSPNYHNRDMFRNVRPRWAYKYVYPSHVNIDHIAYKYDFDMPDDPAYVREVENLRLTVRAWKESWLGHSKPSLVYHRGPRWLKVEDRRQNDILQSYTLSELEGAVFVACARTWRNPSSIMEEVSHTGLWRQTEKEISEILDRFVQQRLAVHEGRSYLTLALPAVPGL